MSWTSRKRWDLVPPLTTLCVGAAMIVGVQAVWPPPACGPEETQAKAAAEGDPNAVQLVVLTSSNKGGLMEEMACNFERTEPTVAGRPLDVVIVSESSGTAIDKISTGAVQPDVWMPASSSWVSMLRQDQATWIPPGLPPSVAMSPQVIAMPKPVAERMGWPEAAVGWNDILELAKEPDRWAEIADPSWGAFKLAKTNPLFSTSGLNTTVATYAAAKGYASDLTLEDLRDPKVLAFVKGVDASVVHYAPTSVDFLRNLRAQDDQGLGGERYVSAVLLEEKSVWDYNQGNPSGDPATLGEEGPPKTPLVAFYPSEGALTADHPYVILSSDWVTPAERAGARAFLRFLLEPDQQRRFQELGFRDHDGVPGPEINLENGLIPAAPATVTPPGGDVLTQIRADWPKYRKRARVLILMDVSGSMRSSVPGTGKTKLELAQTAALDALKQLGPDDEVGLWTFSPPSASAGYVENVPIGPLSENGDALRTAIANLDGTGPTGDTELYTTLEAAVGQLQDDFDPTKVNGVILLSDGANEGANDDRGAAIAAVAPPSPDREVRVFTIAYDAADVTTLADLARSSLGTAYDATDPTTIVKVFNQVVANF